MIADIDTNRYRLGGLSMRTLKRTKTYRKTAEHFNETNAVNFAQRTRQA